MTSQGSPSNDDYVRDSEGKLILDRYGRPVRRRAPRPTPVEPTAVLPSIEDAPVAPQQYIPTPAEQTRIREEQAHAAQTPPRSSRRRDQDKTVRVRRRAEQKPRRRILRKPKRGCMSTFLRLIIILLVLSVAGLLWLDTQLTRIDATPTVKTENTPGTNWLLVGSDSRGDLSEEDVDRLGTGGDIGSQRTDTIMVLHIPNLSSKATLISIPRDSYVDIPGYGSDKINAAFTYGGAPLLTATVEEATGLHMDHYAEIGMGGLAKVVDSIGGIKLCPPEPIDDPLANLNVQAGCQKVDGPTALGYVRTRATAQGDLDRVQRQREFFSALVDKLTSPATLANPFRAIPTINSVAHSFTVGKKDHIWNLLMVGLAMRSGIEATTVPIAGFESNESGSVIIWDDDAASTLFANLR